MPVLIAIDHLHRVVNVRRHALDERNLVLNGHRVSGREGRRVVCACPNAVDGSAAGLDPNEVVAEIVELLLDPDLPGLADGDDADDRGNPDRYTQDREN